MKRFLALRGIGLCSAAALSLSMSVSAQASNYVNMLITHVNDESTSFNGYKAELQVHLDSTGSTVAASIAKSAGGTNTVTMVDDTSNPGDWSGKQTYSDLSSLETALQGNYTITVTSGSSTSTMTYTMQNLFGLGMSGAFLGIPQITSPAQGATGVSATPTFTWTPGSNDSSAFIINASVDSNTVHEDEMNVNGGSLSLGAMSWTPTVTLNGGPATFSILYGNTDPSLVSLILTNYNTTGSVTWSQSPYAPVGYASGGTPLLGLGSQDIRSFTVTPEPASAALMMLGGVALLRRRRKQA